MKLKEHEMLAKEIYADIVYCPMQFYLLAVSNTKEHSFYFESIRAPLINYTTLEQRYNENYSKIILKNGSNLCIVTYTSIELFKAAMCGRHIDKWWTTTELLPEEIRTTLLVSTL